MHMYKIIAMCTKHATVFQANNKCLMCGHKQVKALLFTVDKRMSGSSLGGKAFQRSFMLF